MWATPYIDPAHGFAQNCGFPIAKDRATKKCRVPFARNSPFGCFAQKVPDTIYRSLLTLEFYCKAASSAKSCFRLP